jgi:hypothetical protein
MTEEIAQGKIANGGVAAVGVDVSYNRGLLTS